MRILKGLDKQVMLVTWHYGIKYPIETVFVQCWEYRSAVSSKTLLQLKQLHSLKNLRVLWSYAIGFLYLLNCRVKREISENALFIQTLWNELPCRIFGCNRFLSFGTLRLKNSELMENRLLFVKVDCVPILSCALLLHLLASCTPCIP